MAKLALAFFLFFSFWGSCLAYDLYVNSEADTEYVDPEGHILYPDGTYDRPYLHIQDAINHAFNDLHPDNQVSPPPSVEILIRPNLNGYQEYIELNYRASVNQSHIVQNISITTDPRYYGQCKIVGMSDQWYTISVYGSDSGVLSLKNVELILDSPIASSFAIHFQDNTGQTYSSLQKLEIEDCLFDNYYGVISYCDAIDTLIATSSAIMNLDYHDEYATGPLGIKPQGSNSITNKAIITNNTVTYNSNYMNGVAISLGDFTDVNISNNGFVNAAVNYMGTPDPPFNENVSIANNTFTDSYILLNGPFDSEITNNTFNCPSISEGAIRMINNEPENISSNHTITGNIFWDVPTPIQLNRYDTGNNSQIVSTTLVNNSFIQCGIVAKMYHHLYNNVATNRISSYINNLYLGDSPSPFVVLDSSGQPTLLPEDDRIPVSYSHFRYVLSHSCLNSLDTLNVSYGLPDIIEDTENCTYSLRWDNDVRSPLINSGCPVINGIQTDPDGTPLDIGAVYYPHHHKQYRFSHNYSNNIKWMSFPVLDDRTFTNDNHWNELGYLFDAHMDDPPANQIESASWSYDGDESEMVCLNGDWLQSGFPATQPKGFKLIFNSNIEAIDPVVVNGFKAETSTCKVDLYRGMTNSFENWIGYFVPYTQGAGDAFGRLLPGSTRETYLDHIYGIKTQTWGTSRISNAYNSPWIVDPDKYTLSEGDMVAIVLLPNAPEEMYWRSLSTPETPRTRDMAANFSYTEELDYTPIFIEFDPNDLPDEVGLMVSGECKGAAVVDSSLIEVNYYASAATKGDDEIEIMFYYGGKGKKKAPETRVYNLDTMLFEDGKLKTSQLGDYGYVSFNRSEGTSLVPLVTELKQNYPNPFKGITNISWVLEKDEPIRIDIYNLKGQKVKSFYNGMGKKGRQELSWDAKDKNGQSVASGIYFYRLDTPEGSKVQKMMVLR